MHLSGGGFMRSASTFSDILFVVAYLLMFNVQFKEYLNTLTARRRIKTSPGRSSVSGRGLNKNSEKGE
jgi:hypothetical protein